MSNGRSNTYPICVWIWKIILTFEGLDDFRHIRAFNQGFENKVRTQYPKTLEEAIKSAKIFNDMSDKKSSACNKTFISFSASKNNKCKNSGNSKEDTPKKIEGVRGLLSSNELASKERQVVISLFRFS